MTGPEASMLVLILVACGYPEDDFRTDYVDAYCGWAADCGWYADAGTCTADYAAWDGPSDQCGDYDAHAARDCVKALQVLACPVDDPASEFPSACSAVYPCDAGGSDTD
jgi:hypothetical protein